MNFEELKYPLECLEGIFFSKNRTIIFSEPLLAMEGGVGELFSKVDRESKKAVLIFIFEKIEKISKTYEGKKILHDFILRNGEFYSDFYFHSVELDLIGYCSSRDSLSILSLAKNSLSAEFIEEADRAFRAHVLDTGIGFGDAGIDYINNLLSTMPHERKAQIGFPFERRGY